jgi:hypothetical protein
MMYLVRPALAEDIDAPYIWFSKLPCPSRRIVLIKNKSNGKSVWCEVILAQDNFIERYNRNARTKKVSSDTPFLVSNEWYRDHLGLAKHETATLELRAFPWLPLFVAQALSSFRHPDNSVRLATDIALVSLLLGVIGLLLGALCK